jgi:hypothetical protein
MDDIPQVYLFPFWDMVEEQEYDAETVRAVQYQFKRALTSALDREYESFGAVRGDKTAFGGRVLLGVLQRYPGAQWLKDIAKEVFRRELPPATRGMSPELESYEPSPSSSSSFSVSPLPSFRGNMGSYDSKDEAPPSFSLGVIEEERRMLSQERQRERDERWREQMEERAQLELKRTREAEREEQAAAAAAARRRRREEEEEIAAAAARRRREEEIARHNAAAAAAQRRRQQQQGDIFDGFSNKDAWKNDPIFMENLRSQPPRRLRMLKERSAWLTNLL